MSPRSRIQRIGSAWMISVAVLCAGSWSTASDAQSQPQTTHAQASRTHKKKKPTPPPPPLPSGPTGQIQPIPLDSIAAVAPQVSFENNQLTIVAPNSTLADILKAVRKQTGAEIEIPAAPDRVVTHLGPGPARSVIAELLNGSRFNYVLLGAPGNDAQLTRVVLVPKGPGENAAATASAANVPPPNTETPQPDAAEANDAEAQPDDNPPPDETADQPAEGEQNPDQPQVKTPQQMLQEMQQRQMQLQQQQQQNGPVPNPNTGMPPHPPQEQ